jgi:hypothetical protein
MPTPIAGKFGYVTIGAAANWYFNRWSYHPRCKILPKNTFTAGGYDQNIGGFIGADIRLEGPFDTAPPGPLVVGDLYTVKLGITATGPIEFSIGVRISDVEVTNDAEDEPHLVVNGVSNGPFTPSVLAVLAAESSEGGSGDPPPAGSRSEEHQEVAQA